MTPIRANGEPLAPPQVATGVCRLIHHFVHTDLSSLPSNIVLERPLRATFQPEAANRGENGP